MSIVHPIYHIALYEPEIPPNTGNIARLCAANFVRLHLIAPLGFSLEEKQLRRAGLDYWPQVDLRVHESADAFFATAEWLRLWLVENPAPRHYTEVRFEPGDCLMFGKESAGLPEELLQRYADWLIDVPMPNRNIRSLNLATTAGIVLYEALRQRND